jgi:3-hydroxyacyl-CoA dehydrogenase
LEFFQDAQPAALMPMPQTSINSSRENLSAMPVHRVAVVGTGAIGASWTALFLACGLDVVAANPGPGAEARLRRYVDMAWQALTVMGVSHRGSPEHLTFTSDPLSAVSQVGFVQECVSEDVNLKVKLFAQLDAAAPVEAIIASSSSSLPMSVIQSQCAHPARCVIGHPLNPPHIVPLIEVAGGTKTSPETIAQAMAFYRAIGRKPIHVRKEVLGHVANRLQAALYREVASLIEQQVVDVADADAAVCWGPGLRWGIMGPSLLFHLGGGEGGIHHFMEHLAGPIAACWKDLGNPDLTPQLQEMIIKGVLEEVGTRTLDVLTRERDELLLGLLRLRGKLTKTRATKQSRRPGSKNHES